MYYRKIVGIVTCCAAIAASPAMAAKKEPPQLVQCEETLGTIALIDGAKTGWSEWDLGSPRALINVLAIESGCFTPHTGADGAPARFLVTAIAGSKEDVDQGIELAKAGATEAFVRSGAAGQVLSKVPLGGALIGAFNMFGGKKRTVAAGLSVVSPSNGMTLATGSGSVKKNALKFKGDKGEWARGVAASSGYDGSKNGRMLTEAFIVAFNTIVAQKSVLETAPTPGAAAQTTATAIVATDTSMRALASADAEQVRALRAGTELIPTGGRDGLFIEVTDNYGTKGWVSVEDME